MLDPYVRPLKDLALSPLVRLFSPVNPHAISVVALVAGMGCAWSAARGAFGAAALLWVGNRVCDGLDGAVARRAGRQTDVGGYIDLVFDFLVYAAVPLGIAAGQERVGVPVWEAASFMLASFYINAAAWLYLSAVLEKRAIRDTEQRLTTIAMPEGLVAGTETVIFYLVFLLFPSSIPTGFVVMAVLVAVTALQRTISAIRLLRSG